MQGRQNEVAGFGSGQGDGDALESRISPIIITSGSCLRDCLSAAEKLWVSVPTSAAAGRFLVGVKKLDGVFYGHHIDGPRLVYPVDYGSQSGRFAASRRSGNQNKAPWQGAKPLNVGRKPQLRKAWTLKGTTRNAAAKVPRCTITFPRNRANPLMEWEKSSSQRVLSSSVCSGSKTSNNIF